MIDLSGDGPWLRPAARVELDAAGEVPKLWILRGEIGDFIRETGDFLKSLGTEQGISGWKITMFDLWILME